MKKKKKNKIETKQNGHIIDPSNRNQNDGTNSDDSDLEDIPSGVGSPLSDSEEQPKDYSQASTSTIIPTTPTTSTTTKSMNGTTAATAAVASGTLPFPTLPPGFPFMPGFFPNPLFPNLNSQSTPENMQFFIQMQRQMLSNPQIFANMAAMGLQNFQNSSQNSQTQQQQQLLLLQQQQQQQQQQSTRSSIKEEENEKPSKIHEIIATKKKAKISIDDILNLKTTPIKIKDEIFTDVGNNNNISSSSNNIEEEDENAETTEEIESPPRETSSTEPSNTSSSST
uniref:Uncharacterized protein n=1 Tax=Panagrolaimus superbus TaxID=310955 RepID=A0A914Y0G2_9BILA